MREIDPSRVKETEYKLNTKKLLVVLECLKDRTCESADCLCSFVIMLLARSDVEC